MLLISSLQDDNDVLETDFLQRLGCDDISELRRYFFSNPQNGLEKIRSLNSSFNEPNRGKPLNKTDFIQAVANVTGTDLTYFTNTDDSRKLFDTHVI